MSIRISNEDNIIPIKKHQNIDIKVERILENIDIINFLEEEYNIFFEVSSENEYKTSCPFPWHRDSTPSFFVNIDKKLFHCFGCQKSGTIINFVMSMENLNFIDAIDKLYALIGEESSDEAYQTAKAMRQIDNLIKEYIDRSDVSPYPSGMSENRFLLLINRRMKEYEQRVENSEEELKWIETIYQELDRLILEQNYKEISNFWRNMSNIISQRYKEWREKND